MISSKKLFTLLLPLFFVFTACVKADRQSEADTMLNQFSTESSLIDFNNRALFEAGNIQLEDIQFVHSGVRTDENGQTQTSTWKAPDRIQLFFKLCNIRDRASQGTIRGEKFHISSEIGTDISDESVQGRTITNPVTVNNGNCLRWSQYIPEFNFVAPSHNIVLHYEFESLAGGMGRIIRRVGFNPWDMHRNQSRRNVIFDLTDFDRQDWHAGRWVVGEADIIKALKGELVEGESRLDISSIQIEPLEAERERTAEYNRRLEGLSEEERRTRQSIEAALLNTQNRQGGMFLNINMTALPFVRVTDATGLVHDQDITTGRFRIFMNLIANGGADNPEKVLISHNMYNRTGLNASAYTWEMTTNGLQASLPVLINRIPRDGRVFLALKIVPLDLKGVKEFSGVYDLGLYNNWVRRQNPSFRRENYEVMNNIDFDRYIEEAIHDTEELEEFRRNRGYYSIATLPQAERFWFGPLRMRFVRIMPGESATDRTLMYSVTTCVKHALTGAAVGPGLQFDITTWDKKDGTPATPEDPGRPHNIRRQTNESGCLTWFGFLSHKFYHKEVLTEKKADVRFVGTRVDESQWDDIRNRYSKEFIYYMNAWDEKWTFGWDRPDMPEDYPSQIEEQRATAPASKLFIADFRYETMGFRYSIDKYLKLKVKKAVLLKAYPYVLKYNSIVLGRNATYKLRDGVYLMKIALQKDYLDPAAKGVRIYDRENDSPLTLESNPTGPHPVATYGDEEINHRLLTQTELEEGRKQYISVQQKLVRVIGGMIITPIEFEVSDLRLMRIRNQFFIQLQTIDEHKLRLASVLNQSLNELYNDQNIINPINGEVVDNRIEDRYREVFRALDEIQDIRDQRVELEANNQHGEELGEQAQAELQERLRELEMSLAEAQERLNEMLGLSGLDPDSELYQRRRALLEEKFRLLDEFRQYDVDAQTTFRNNKRALINRLIRGLGQENGSSMSAEELLNHDWADENNFDRDYVSSVADDPLQRFFFMGELDDATAMQRIIDYRIQSAREAGDGRGVEDFSFLQSADFTESPLAPDFSFDMLRNDGLEAHQSGLPSRTFVGPLTFVFNTNGSSLRPTDILNEEFCTTAFCEIPDMISQGVPPERVENSFSLEGVEDGEVPQFAGASNEPIYDSGDSVNATYENNKYYGYLKAYYNMTVDDLIEQKREVDDNYVRKMEAGSQVINFLKTNSLKYVLLDESDSRSHLKSVNYDCVQDKRSNPTVEDIRANCFDDIHNRSEMVTRSDDFMNALNNRRGRIQISSEDEDERYGLRSSWLTATYSGTQETISKEELLQVMDKGWENTELDPKLIQTLHHRMCFVLSQNIFSDGYFDKRISVGEKLTKAFTKQTMNRRSVARFEQLCHEYINNMYGYDVNTHLFPTRTERPRPRTFNPIVFERKIRAYETTDRYVYRGGKSLNINVSTSFGLSSSTGIKTSTTANYKIDGGTISGLFSSIPIVGDIYNTVVGGFSVGRSVGRDEAAGRTNGTTVSSGTFLVSQQATFDIELGEYERCMVARFHPAFVSAVLEESDSYLKNAFNENEDIEYTGVMICAGQRDRKCLPVKEKYYYFTQHFTEGDMLDTADLHNHPWLLELRGYRDFQAFAKTIGAREVDYIDNRAWVTDVASRVLSDTAAMNWGPSHSNQMSPEFQSVNQEEDMNWPIEEMSRTYLEILPTFPGLYTYMNETGIHVSEWPYTNTDPGQSFNQCEQ